MSGKHLVNLNQSGAAAIIAVLIIGAASLIIARSVMFVGLSALDRVATADQGQAALSMADGCLTEILRRLQIDPGWQPDKASFTVGDYACAAVSNDWQNSSGEILVTANKDNYYKMIKADVTADQRGVDLNSWQEVGN